MTDPPIRLVSDRKRRSMSARIPQDSDQRSPSNRTPGREGTGRAGVVSQNYQSSEDRWQEWIAVNLPEEVGNAYVYSAVMQFWCRHPRHKRTEPNPDDVRGFLRDRGEDNASLRRDA